MPYTVVYVSTEHVVAKTKVKTLLLISNQTIIHY